MTLSNKKANHDHIDRISDLPCNVIDDILARLYIKDLVRTSILSKKWRYMWTSVPQLRFDDDFFDEYENLDDPGPVTSKVITDVLMQHSGVMHKFHLYVHYDYNFKISVEYIDTWIPILSRSIKHLELVSHNKHLDQMPYIVFSCKELTFFTFAGLNCQFHLISAALKDCLIFTYCLLHSRPVYLRVLFLVVRCFKRSILMIVVVLNILNLMLPLSKSYG
jgi:hypothetical protein